MKAQSTTVQHTNVLDELIDNAVGLPVGSQDLLLMMAKAMRHTRNCLIGDVERAAPQAASGSARIGPQPAGKG